MKDKILEICKLMQEVKYVLSNYIGLSKSQSEKEEMIFRSPEEELGNTILECEALKLKIYEMNTENDIIKMILNDFDS
jgi:hypothetical protein